MELENMFFNFRYVKTNGTVFSLSGKSPITSEVSNYPLTYAKQVIDSQNEEGIVLPVSLIASIPDSIKNQVGDLWSEHSEAYALTVTDEAICLYGNSKNGLIYAVSTLKQLLKGDALAPMTLYDYPDKDIRGYRIFTPGHEENTAFKDMVDQLIDYKYNTIIMEIGGALEYKSHPEINAHWVEFCKEVHQSPNESRRIQHQTHPWHKNSIHADNGCGSFITQDEMREIIAYCEERGFSVYPEVPSLGHCDYLVMAHPEIAERENDTYPDTYCPSNPKSYEILFDILEEIIDIFKPKYLNIGHDETYTLSICPRCRHKSPVDLYVEDITKINDFLNARGVTAMMWCEKMLGNVYTMRGDGHISPAGGTGIPANEMYEATPRLGECAGRIPKNIILLHWYWSIASKDEEDYLRKLGYNILFGNFIAPSLKKYRARAEKTLGGFVSNWGSFKPEYMQRNGQNFALLSTAYIFWNHDYDNADQPTLIRKLKTKLYEDHKATLGSDIIELMHTTEHNVKFRAFYDGYYIVPEDWTLGHHKVTYTDGTTTDLPVIFGYNIRNSNEVADTDVASADTDVTGYVEALGASYPTYLGNKLYFRTAYKNPHPDKEIASIRYIPKDDIAVNLIYPL